MSVEYFRKDVPLFDYFIPLCSLIIVLVCTNLCPNRRAGTVLIFCVNIALVAISFSAIYSPNELPEKTNRLILLIAQPKHVEFFLVPSIIFEFALSFDYWDLRKVFWQMLVIIIPCFVTSMLVLGCTLFVYWYIALPEGFDVVSSIWNVFQSSALLSSTDPITVSALVDEIGVSHQLETLLKAESLFGPAVSKLSGFLVSIPYNFEGMAAAIIRVSLLIACVSVAYLGGRILAELLGKYLYFDHVAELSFSFAVVYGCYTFGSWGDFGILGVVILAITFNSCRSSVSERTYDDLRRFWKFAAFCCHALLISLSGVTVGAQLVANINEYHNLEAFTRAAAMAGIILFAVASRFVSILVFTPLLRCGGEFELEFVALLVIGGLRSFLSLTSLYHQYKMSFGGIGGKSGSAWLLFEAAGLKRDIEAVQATFVVSQIFQGLNASKVTKILELETSKKFRVNLMKSLGRRMNAEMSSKIAGRRSESDVNWNLIERELTFEFDMITEDDDTQLFLEEITTTEEAETRERVQRCYEAQVRKIWPSYGGVSSVAGRALLQSIHEAGARRRTLDIDDLFDHLQARPIWRKIAKAGRKCYRLLRLQRLFASFSIYDKFWHWRLFIFIVSTLRGAYSVVWRIFEHEVDLSLYH